MSVAVGMFLFGLFAIISTAVFCSVAANEKRKREERDKEDK